MYSIELLKKEKALIDKCLSSGNWDNYKEPYNRQLRKSKDLSRSIKILEDEKETNRNFD